MTIIHPVKKINDIKKLKLIANRIRQDIIISLTKAGSGHSAGSLGMADVFTALYFNLLNRHPRYPFWKGRDIFVLSNGHICPGLYATLAHAGYFPRSELKTLRKFGTRLQGHPHRPDLPGLETSSGPLGCGLSQAAGMAYALRMDQKKNHVYCLISDGEQDEGNTWEAVMFASAYKLHNLTVIMDRNRIQIDGNTEEIMPLEPLAEKYRAFNWQVIEIDGNDISSIIKACHEAKTIYEKPTLIIAHNIPGKGVSFMENDYTWHGRSPLPHQAKLALKELKAYQKKILQGKE